MLLSIKHRFLFIACAKTASSSIHAGLLDYAEISRDGTPQRRHIPYSGVEREFAFLFALPQFAPDTFTKFAVMRDPVERVYSWYRYRRGNKVGNPIPQEMTFAQYWERKDWSIARRDGTPNLQRQSVTDAEDRVALDLILPHDDLAPQFARLMDLLALPVTLGSVNKSRIRGSSDEIDPAIRSEMQEFFAADYDLLESLPRHNAVGFARLEQRLAG